MAISTFPNKSLQYREPAADFNEDGGNNEIVLLDLKTSGLHMNCEILQIAAQCSGGGSFYVYITPVKSIPDRVTCANGLSTSCEGLMFRGVPVRTISMNAALRNLHNWLTSLGKNCYITTFNLNFDGPRLLKAITEHFSRKKFAEVVHGFIDALCVMRNVTGLKGECKLIDLAEQLDISTFGIHNAVHACEILHQILRKLDIKKAILLKNSMNFTEQIELWDAQERSRKALKTLAPLRRLVGSTILKKLANAEIDLRALQSCNYEGGLDQIHEYLRAKIENKSLESLDEESIQIIVDAFADYWGE